MILPIYLDPQPILRQKTQNVPLEELKSEQFQQLVKDMIVTMRNAPGIGLAAPQVGLGKRLTVIDLLEVNHRTPPLNPPLGKGGNGGVLTLINPKITKKSFRKILMEEGCLSIPGIFGTVKRPREVRIEYLDLDGQVQTLDAAGLLARVIQHEVDHLEGVLFTDKVKEYTSQKRGIPDYPHV